MMRTLRLASILCACVCAVPVLAQGGGSIDIEVEPVECIPIGDNAVAWVDVEGNRPDTAVRLYFRRMHKEVEDFYYSEMNPVGGGRYWGVFPKAEDEELSEHELEEDRETVPYGPNDDDSDYRWAEWWRAKEASEDRDPNDDLDRDVIEERASLGKDKRRDWMFELDDRSFEEWLERQVNEPAEYFVAVVDGQGRVLAESPMMVTEVREPRDCDVEFTPQEAGEKENLTVGETAAWQKGEQVFHWLCDGVVTRIDPYGVLRGDEVCRVCVIAWWRQPGVLIPTGILAVVPVGVIISETDPTPVSPSRP